MLVKAKFQEEMPMVIEINKKEIFQLGIELLMVIVEIDKLFHRKLMTKVLSDQIRKISRMYYKMISIQTDQASIKIHNDLVFRKLRLGKAID
jgi:hypothetical protein